MIKYQKLAANAPTPHRAHPTDAGVDLTANNLPGTRDFKGKVAISPGHSQQFGTGIAVAIPAGHVGLLFVRSSVGCKMGLAPANAVGVIDADYRGEIQIVLHNHSSNTQIVAIGQRICQLVIVPVDTSEWGQVDALEATERGAGGFGSTNTN